MPSPDSGSSAKNKDHRVIVVHPATVRVTHWINVAAMFVMITSGWRIYNASPLFEFTFPRDLTLGGWLGGALLWHFAAMWVLVVNGLVYLAHGILSGHYRKDILPIAPKSVLKEGLRKGDVKKAANQKATEMKPMMDQEEKSMPAK
jgi:thiosulfate reductase cytochrome b subunit